MICPFCDLYINNNLVRLIDQNDLAIVIHSNPCLMKYHLLVIPKRHVQRLDELTKDELDAMFKLIIKYEKIILSKFARLIICSVSFVWGR